MLRHKAHCSLGILNLSSEKKKASAPWIIARALFNLLKSEFEKTACLWYFILKNYKRCHLECEHLEVLDELIMKLALSAEMYSYLWINSFLKEDLYKNFGELYQNTIDI